MKKWFMKRSLTYFPIKVTTMKAVHPNDNTMMEKSFLFNFEQALCGGQKKHYKIIGRPTKNKVPT